MKKIVLNISDSTYEKLRFEAIIEKKSVQQIIQERVFHKPFDSEVEEAFEDWMNLEIDKIIKE
jgi:predicted CopG family antitoxin